MVIKGKVVLFGADEEVRLDEVEQDTRVDDDAPLHVFLADSFLALEELKHAFTVILTELDL